MGPAPIASGPEWDYASTNPMVDPDPFPASTFFAPAGRAQPAPLREAIQACLESPVTQAILASLDGYVAVLNEERQILAANRVLLDALVAEGQQDPLGRRWGEVAGCVHAGEGPDGCGTARACSCCGAAISILATQRGGQPHESECRMAIRGARGWEGRELQARASTLDLACGRLLVVVFHDISDHKRREALESMFLHDLANTVQALNVRSELLESGLDNPVEAAHQILEISHRLSEAVQHQRLLIRAESGELRIDAKDVAIGALLSSLAETLAGHPAGRGQVFRIQTEAGPGQSVRTDPVLLFRVLLNMGVNALEASGPGDPIRIGCQHEGDRVRFFVGNPGAMPEAVALQVFHRSFSTKPGAGRGLGTHSMKVLGENYLHGQVGFHSSAADGTVFHIQLPVTP
jgi:signal transduction histidine kinase